MPTYQRTLPTAPATSATSATSAMSATSATSTMPTMLRRYTVQSWLLHPEGRHGVWVRLSIAGSNRWIDVDLHTFRHLRDVEQSIIFAGHR